MNKCLRRVFTLATGMGFLVAAPVLHAQAPNVYIGAGAGVADFEDDVEVRDIGDVDIDDDSTAYKFFGGYRATENFAIEGGYRDFGKAKSGPFSVEVDGFDVSALGLLPIGPFDLFAKGGVIFWDTKGRGGFPDDDGEDLTYGVGVTLNVASLWFRLESEWFDMDIPDDTQMITASVGWTFQ